MRVVLFEWRGVKFHPYPVMNYAGIVLGVIVGTFAAASRGLSADRVNAALLLLVLPALFGARLLFVATHWDLYRHEPARILRRADGGASLFGGLVLAFLVSLPLLHALRIGVGAFWDIGSITILVGMVLTKIGCFLNGCCAGRLSEGRIAMLSRNERGILGRRVPAQLLESGLAALLLIAMLGLFNHLPFDGAIFLTALGGYGAGRYWLESIRESIDSFGRVNVNRIVSAALVGLSTTSFLILWFRT